MIKQMKEEKLLKDPTRQRSVLMEDGSEDHSDSGGPLVASIRLTQRDNLGERVRDMIKSERLALEAASAGYETFEESDDFDVPEDDTYDPQTPYEEVFEGSVMEDATERYKHQQQQLRGVKADRLKEFLGAMDPEELQSAIDQMALVRKDKDEKDVKEDE